MATLLFVTSRLPYPPHEGHQLRAWHLLRAAARRHRVILLSVRRDDDPATIPEEITAITADCITVPLPPLHAPRTAAALAFDALRGRCLLAARYGGAGMRAAFARLVREADLVHLDILAVARLRALVPPGVPVVLDEHNVEHLLLQERAALAHGWRRRLLQQQCGPLRRFEQESCAAADRVLACSDTDAQRLRALAPATAVDVIPNGIDLAHYTPAPALEDECTLVFVGQMGWFPNRDAVQYMIDAILPRIRARMPARFVVIGKHGGMDGLACAQRDVEFTGFIDDLRPRVQQAAVYVVPLRAGSGTRLKLLEAMALGKAIVTTSIGAEGIALVDGESALFADDEQAFADAVCRLLGDRALRRKLGAAARAVAEREYGWDAIGGRLGGVYEEVLGRRCYRQQSERAEAA